MPWLQITQLEKVEQFLAGVLNVSVAELHQKFQDNTDIFVVKYFDPFSSLKGALIGSKNPEKPENIKIDFIAFHKPLSAVQTEKILAEVRTFCQTKGIKMIIENKVQV
ncbi:MAG: hypothetical protein ACFFC7_09805 [Candidatus Hermodarchaeota archaeon]